VKNTANCLLQCTATGGARVAKEGNKFWLECDASDVGEAKCNETTGEKIFVGKGDVHHRFRQKDGNPNQFVVHVGGDTMEITRDAAVGLSSCMSSLVLPACLATSRQTGVYHTAVNRVQRMMTHVRGFEAADAKASEFAERARKIAMQRDNHREWSVLFLMPLENQFDPPDFTIDFDTVNGWALGFSPSEQTDAAESAQAYLSWALDEPRRHN
jgi:hypothetical protein